MKKNLHWLSFFLLTLKFHDKNKLSWDFFHISLCINKVAYNFEKVIADKASNRTILIKLHIQLDVFWAPYVSCCEHNTAITNIFILLFIGSSINQLSLEILRSAVKTITKANYSCRQLLYIISLNSYMTTDSRA